MKLTTDIYLAPEVKISQLHFHFMASHKKKMFCVLSIRLFNNIVYQRIVLVLRVQSLLY